MEIGKYLSEVASKGVRKTVSAFGYSREVDKRAATLANASPESSGVNTKQDAARHMLLSAKLANMIGAVPATGLLASYEYLTGGPGKETQMDLHNNKIGASIQYTTEEELDTKVKELLGKTQLEDFSDPNSPVILQID